MNKLFVGGLSWETNDDELYQAFEKFGTIREAKVILDRETGRSRGFGFVTFERDGDAKTALGMDETILDGRSLRVSLAEERKGGGARDGAPRRDTGPYGGGGYTGERSNKGGERAPKRSGHVDRW